MDMGQSHIMYRLPMPAAPGAPISEFNHHLAGILVFIVGLAALLMYARPRSTPALRYVWPTCLLLLGVYLMLYSDPDGWPAAMGVGLADSLRRDPSALQHKVFAVLLMLMGGIEIARTSRVVRGSAWRLAFPILAAIGALYLIVHEHNAAEHMMMPHMSEEMGIVRVQHMIYLTLGVGIAVTKILSDTHRSEHKWLPYAWPTLTMLLGIALILYRE